MKQLAPFIVMIALAAIVSITLINWFHYRLKKRLLEAGPTDEPVLRMVHELWQPGAEALKWGLLLLAGGIGLVVNGLLPYSARDSAIPYGIEAIFLAGGFLVYYFIIRKKV